MRLELSNCEILGWHEVGKTIEMDELKYFGNCICYMVGGSTKAIQHKPQSSETVRTITAGAEPMIAQTQIDHISDWIHEDDTDP